VEGAGYRHAGDANGKKDMATIIDPEEELVWGSYDGAAVRRIHPKRGSFDDGHTLGYYRNLDAIRSRGFSRGNLLPGRCLSPCACRAVPLTPTTWRPSSSASVDTS
jgi:hypothetical protein